MAFPSLSRLVDSSSSFLPNHIRAIVHMERIRTELRLKRFDYVAALVEQTGSLTSCDDVPATKEACLRALSAMQNIMLAIARRRAGDHSSESEKTFHLADTLFASLVETDPISVSLLAGDYLNMLADFHASERIDAFSQRHFVVGRPWLLDCVAACIAPVPLMFLHLEAKILAQYGVEAAERSLTYAAGLALACAKYDVALQAIERILVHRPQDGDAHRLRGLLRLDAGALEGAIEDFTASLLARPDDTEAHVALGYIHLAKKDPLAAIAAAESVLATRPDQPDALSLRGEARRRLGDARHQTGQPAEAKALWKVALRDLDAALDAQHSAPFYRARSVIALRLEMPDRAIEDLDEAAQLEVEDSETCAWRAESLLSLNRHSEALNTVNLGLALLENTSAPDSMRSWLLILKAKSTAAWSAQAFEALWQAVSLDPGNEQPSRLLLEGYRETKDWAGLADAAKRLQQIAREPRFLGELRNSEVEALRQSGRLREALTATQRDPIPHHSDLIWLRGRLLCDIGDFESARAYLSQHPPEAGKRFDYVSMLGWVLQNLEPLDHEERRDFALQGARLYEEALHLKAQNAQGRASDLNDETLVWVKKGIANANLRAGSIDFAEHLYNEIIDDCEQMVLRTDRNALTFALIGWCQLCLRDTDVAAHYYQAALESGLNSIPVLFDYSLVLAAHGADPTQAFESYKSTAVKARDVDVLRQIGDCRVALRDLRELLFRQPDVAGADKIVQMLCMEIADAITSHPGLPPEYLQHLEQFLATCIQPPVPLTKPEFEAISARVRYVSLLSRNDASAALRELEQSARLYGELQQREWESSTWYEVALCGIRLKDQRAACLPSARALEAGLYAFNPPAAFLMLQNVTFGAVDGCFPLPTFRSLVETVFRQVGVGPAQAYRDGAHITQPMTPNQHDLFASTVVDLFPPVRYESPWIYLDEQVASVPIPDTDQVLKPFLKYLIDTPFMNPEIPLQNVEV